MPENRARLVLASVRAWIQISEGEKRRFDSRLPVFTIHLKGNPQYDVGETGARNGRRNLWEPCRNQPAATLNSKDSRHRGKQEARESESVTNDV